jgi:hypothetical protein
MTRRASIAVAVLAAVLVGTGAACDAPAPGVATVASGPPGSGPARPSLTEEQMAIDFVRCIRNEGLEIADPQRSAKGGFTVPMPDPPPGLDKSDPAFDAFGTRVEAALDRCGPLAPPGTFGDVVLSAEELQRELRFAGCMRRHGVNWPDPVNGKRAEPSRTIRDNPNVVTDLRECRAEP